MDELDAAIVALKEKLTAREQRRTEKATADEQLASAQSSSDTAKSALTLADQDAAQARDAAIAAIQAAAQ